MALVLAGRAHYAKPATMGSPLRPLRAASTTGRPTAEALVATCPARSGAHVQVDVVERIFGPRTDQLVAALAIQDRSDGVGVELAVDAGEVAKAGRRDRGQGPVPAVQQAQAEVLDSPRVVVR